jgi:nitrate/TMAO reductase-like tetraheme cytochrome c subunit
MPKYQKHHKRKRTPLILPPAVKILLIVCGVALLFTAGGFTFAATKETHDTFCASCHTQPESTFYQRSVDAQAVDLASAHTAKNVRCIDCHSGVGVVGRITAELLGAHNALAFYTGTAVQPAILTRPVGDNSCLKCHQDVTVRADFNNHFHAFLSRWQAFDPNAATCVSCHGGHTTTADAQTRFVDQNTAQNVCEACHRATGRG